MSHPTPGSSLKRKYINKQNGWGMQRQSEKIKEIKRHREKERLFLSWKKSLVFLSLTDRSEKSVLFFLTHLCHGPQHVGIGWLKKMRGKRAIRQRERDGKKKLLEIWEVLRGPSSQQEVALLVLHFILFSSSFFASFPHFLGKYNQDLRQGIKDKWHMFTEASRWSVNFLGIMETLYNRYRSNLPHRKHLCILDHSSIISCYRFIPQLLQVLTLIKIQVMDRGHAVGSRKHREFWDELEAVNHRP